MKTSRLFLSLAVLAIWITITFAVGRLVPVDPGTTMPEMLGRGVNPAFVIDIVFMFGAIWVFGWNDLGLNAPVQARSLVILWLPLIFVGFLVIGILVAGPPPRQTMAFLLVNTMLVGISEELMFRGILFQGLRSRYSIWPSIWLTALLFGAIHLLNSSWIGNFTLTVIQSCTAFSTGMLLMAIRIRTKSLDTAIIFHAIWDFCAITITASSGAASTSRPDVGLGVAMVAGIFALITLSYAIFLLRHASRPEPV